MPMYKIARPIMVSMLLRSLFLFRNRRILRSIMLVIISGGASCSRERDVSRKVIVLSVNGLLCFEQYIKCTPRRFNPRNIMARPGLLEFFRILLNNFEVGIWSSMAPARLSKVIRYLLPMRIRLRLLFCYGQKQVFQAAFVSFLRQGAIQTRNGREDEALLSSRQNSDG